MTERTLNTAKYFGILDKVISFEKELNEIEYLEMENDSISLDGWWDDIRHVIIVPRYTIPVADTHYFRKLSALKNSIVDLSGRHGLHRTPDSIENYGNHLYIVLKCDTSWWANRHERPTWYGISADGGETWTRQLLTTEEMHKELDAGHIVMP